MNRRPHLLLLLLAAVLTVVAPSPAVARTAVLGAFVRVQPGLDAAAVVRASAPEVEVVRDYPRVSTAFVRGATATIDRLARLDAVVHVQRDRPLQWLGDTSPWANMAVGEPIYRVRMGAFFGAAVRPIADIAPSPDPAAVALNARPMYGRPYARV